LSGLRAVAAEVGAPELGAKVIGLADGDGVGFSEGLAEVGSAVVGVVVGFLVGALVL
jgi:hypothetical protein